MTRSRHSRRNTATPTSKRALRLEHLEPRLVLSAGLVSQAVAARGVAVGASAAAAVTVSASADAYVSTSSPLTNYGNATDLLVQSSATGRAGSEADTYLKFDLSGVTGPITKAVLNLTALGPVSGASSMVIGVQLLPDAADGWVEGSGGTNRSPNGPITWLNSPDGWGKIVTIPGNQIGASTPIAIDVTQLINQSINANGIASFVIGVISRPGGNQAVDFASRENVNVAMRPTLSVTGASLDPPPTVAQTPAITGQTNTTVGLSVLGADSVDGEGSLTYTWSVASPAGAAAPTFSDNGANSSQSTTVTFHQAGSYVFTTRITDAKDGLSVTTSSITVTVGQVLTGISISPSTATVVIGGQQQFTAKGVDQFKQNMAIPAGDLTWSVVVGSFSGNATTSTVTYVAPNAPTADTITATDGSLTATAAVTVVKSQYLGLLDPALASLTQSLDVDGSISRADMISILRSVETENGGVVDTMDLSDLKTILKDATVLSMPNYVLVLAGDVVSGNAANATYQGQRLGNLAVGSTAAQLDDLIDKWFYGTDLPATGGYSYDTTTAGVLFTSGGPSHADELQGNLGDCYFISALGSIADSSQAAIKNMFIDNGDGTWTVRFYAGGTADYVTVNSQLPVDSRGNLVFDGYGVSSQSSANVLWIELAEKAYAQWNQTGKEGRDGRNSYASIEGGWMGDVDAQVLGHAAANYSMTDHNAQQAFLSAVTGHEAVTIGTVSNPASGTGLYGNHAYAVIGYNSSTGLFTLYNPWGTNQPAALSWTQLVKSCDGFSVADPSGTVPISAAAAPLIAPVIAPPATEQVSTPLDSTASPAAGTDGLAVQNARRSRAAAIDALFADRDASTESLLEAVTIAMRHTSVRPSDKGVAGAGDIVGPESLVVLAPMDWRQDASPDGE